LRNCPQYGYIHCRLSLNYISFNGEKLCENYRVVIENLKKKKSALYSNLEEAIVALKETATTKFVECRATCELNIDPKYADQQLRTTVTLPHGGKLLSLSNK
jgi:ribosomal protein L1